MSEMTREERYALAKQKRELAEKERKSGGFEKIEAPQFETVCLKANKGFPLRFIGNPPEARELNSDALLVERSLIKGDDDKFFTLIWSQDSEHPMRKLMRTILGKYTWNQDTKSRVYDNVNIPVFQRFMTNGQTGNPFNMGANPQKYILVNVIDKSDSWCKDNKHTKMLCWDCTEKEVDGKKHYYPTYGVKPSLIKELWDVKSTMMNKHPEDFDILVRRLDKNTQMAGKYLVTNLPEEKSAIKQWGEKDGVDYLSMLSDELLSDSEAKYERYSLENLPFVSLPTPCGFILNKLGKFIKEVDSQFHTNHYEEFVNAKAKELEELKAKQSEKGEIESTTVENTKVESEVKEQAELPTNIEEKPVAVKKVAKVPKTEPTTFVDDNFLETFPAYEELSKDDKDLITGYNGGILTFKEEADCECPSCGNLIPDPMTQCPYCGQSFE